MISPDELTLHRIATCTKDDRISLLSFPQSQLKLWSVKMDFLGLKILPFSCVRGVIRKHRGKKKISIPFLSMIKGVSTPVKGQTTGVFQLESAGMKRYLKQLKPTNLEDIIAMVSLYRPGPMGGFPIIFRKHKEKGEIRTQIAQRSARKTFGIAIYQRTNSSNCSSVRRIFLTGQPCLRRAIGKKLPRQSLLLSGKRIYWKEPRKWTSEKLAVGAVMKLLSRCWVWMKQITRSRIRHDAYQTAYLKANSLGYGGAWLRP